MLTNLRGGLLATFAVVALVIAICASVAAVASLGLPDVRQLPAVAMGITIAGVAWLVVGRS